MARAEAAPDNPGGDDVIDKMNKTEQISEAEIYPSNLNSSSPQTSHQSFSCFINPRKESRHFWKSPVKFFHVAVRELSVLLILIETLILLGGYLIILGVHHSIRYCLSKIRHKAFPSDNNDAARHQPRHYYPPRPIIPRRVPRGRMAGG